MSYRAFDAAVARRDANDAAYEVPQRTDWDDEQEEELQTEDEDDYEATDELQDL